MFKRAIGGIIVKWMGDGVITYSLCVVFVVVNDVPCVCVNLFCSYTTTLNNDCRPQPLNINSLGW